MCDKDNRDPGKIDALLEMVPNNDPYDDVLTDSADFRRKVGYSRSSVVVGSCP